jgi:hypothetical protein
MNPDSILSIVTCIILVIALLAWPVSYLIGRAWHKSYYDQIVEELKKEEENLDG